MFVTKFEKTAELIILLHSNKKCMQTWFRSILLFLWYPCKVFYSLNNLSVLENSMTFCIKNQLLLCDKIYTVWNRKKLKLSPF